MSSEDECPVVGSNEVVMMQVGVDDLREPCSRRSKSPRVPDPTQIRALLPLGCAQPKFRDATILFFMYEFRPEALRLPRLYRRAGPSFGPDLRPFITWTKDGAATTLLPGPSLYRDLGGRDHSSLSRYRFVASQIRGLCLTSCSNLRTRPVILQAEPRMGIRSRWYRPHRARTVGRFAASRAAIPRAFGPGPPITLQRPKPSSRPRPGRGPPREKRPRTGSKADRCPR